MTPPAGGDQPRPTGPSFDPPVLTGFEFVAGDSDALTCKLKTSAGDLFGAFHNADSIKAGAILVADGAETADGPAGIFRWLGDRLKISGVVSFRLEPRDGIDPLAAMLDVVTAATFLSDFGVDKLLLAGDRHGAAAILASVPAIESTSAVLVFDPPRPNHPDAIWPSHPTRFCFTQRRDFEISAARVEIVADIDPADSATRNELADWCRTILLLDRSA